MNWVKAHWRALAIALALLLGTAWYSRPVDVYGLGLGELDAINVCVQHNKPGQGVDIVWSAGALPGGGQWKTLLGELERLRFRRPPGNLIREHFQSESIQTQPTDLTSVVFYLYDQNGQSMMLQIGARHSCYTSLLTNQNLPMSLSGGEDAAQSLIRRLQEI